MVELQALISDTAHSLPPRIWLSAPKPEPPPDWPAPMYS